MPKRSIDQGFQRFEFRHGLTAKPPRGMNRSVDPGAIPTDQFWLLENCRIQGNEIVERGGQSKLISTPLNGAVVGLWDAGIVDYRPKFYTYFSSHVHTYNHDQSPQRQKAVATVGQTALIGLYNHDEPITIGDVSGTTTFYVGKYFSAAASDGDYIPRALFTASTPSGGFRGPSFQLGDSLYFQQVDTGIRRIYSWNANTGVVAISDTDVVSGGSGTLYNDKLEAMDNELYYVGFPENPTTTSRVRKRSVAGTWSTVGTFTGTTRARGLTYFPTTRKLYVAASTALESRIYEITSSSVTLVRTIALATEVWSMAAFNGYLYFIYWNNTAAELRLGRFDGTTWTDNHAIPTGTTPGASISYELIPIDGELWLIEEGGGGSTILKSTALDTSSSAWITDSAAAANFQWDGLVPIVTT